jgi:hypothetical protein
MAQVMLGGVVSTTVSELVQAQLWPHEEVAEQLIWAPLLTMLS